MTYDGRTDTGRILFTDYEDGDVVRWDAIGGRGIGGVFSFDFDRGGCLLGFEVRAASIAMPPGFWDDAERV